MNNNESQNITYPIKNISISHRVYEFASNPENFPDWVEFIQSMRNEIENAGEQSQICETSK